MGRAFGVERSTVAGWLQADAPTVPAGAALHYWGQHHGGSADHILFGEGGEYRGVSQVASDLETNLRRYVCAQLNVRESELSCGIGPSPLLELVLDVVRSGLDEAEALAMLAREPLFQRPPVFGRRG